MLSGPDCSLAEEAGGEGGRGAGQGEDRRYASGPGAGSTL